MHSDSSLGLPGWRFPSARFFSMFSRAPLWGISPTSVMSGTYLSKLSELIQYFPAGFTLSRLSLENTKDSCYSPFRSYGNIRFRVIVGIENLISPVLLMYIYQHIYILVYSSFIFLFVSDSIHSCYELWMLLWSFCSQQWCLALEYLIMDSRRESENVTFL